MKEFTDYCRDFIIDVINDYKGEKVYGCDLGRTLCEGINVNGTATFSRKEAKEYIYEWWDDASDFSDHEEFNFGERSNPFDNPEAFMVKMVIEGVDSLLSQCQFIYDNWNDGIILTEEVINSITSDIEEFDVQF